jgi:hypothetical protein
MPDPDEYEDDEDPRGAGTGSPCDKIVDGILVAAVLALVLRAILILVSP